MSRVRAKKSSRKAPAKQGTETFKALFQYAAIPFTLITSLLYLFGRVYYEAYLSAWGLSENLFPFSKEQSVVAGFWQSLILCATILSKLNLLMIALSGAMIAVIISMYRPFTDRLTTLFAWLRRKTLSFRRNNSSITPMHDKALSTISGVVSGISFLFVFLTAMVLSYLWIAKQAKEDAKRLYSEILSGKDVRDSRFSLRAVLHVKKESKTFDIYSGHLIQTSSTHIALYDKAKGILIFPQIAIARIEIPEHKVVVPEIL